MKAKHHPILFLLIILGNSLLAQGITYQSLRCNSMENPLAIGSKTPGLSWIVGAEGYNRSQSAYQVLVASSPGRLSEEDADLWNSGKVYSAQSTHVKYGGDELLSGRKYWWKVRIWDEKGRGADWSQVNHFETGLFHESDWGASEWICLGEDTRSSEHRFREYKTGGMDKPVLVTSQPAAYLRKEISMQKPVQSARAYICGLGYYELYLNGEKTGDHVLDPAPSNYEKQAYYAAYDVTSQLKAGKNAVGIILGNGFYGQDISWKSDPESEKDLSYGVPAVRLVLKVSYTDGTREMLFSDGDWKASTGPIVFDNVYGGDTYDARFEIPGWNTADYKSEDWAPVGILSPVTDKLSAQEIPPIRKLQELSPQRVFLSPVTGKWIVDFGQNIAGWIRITVNEQTGRVIDIIPTEALTRSGEDIFPGSTGGGANGMKQLLRYICKGGGPETWEPRFSYHGFRFAEISGLSKKPDKNDIRAILVASDVQHQGSFSCSDPLLNRMDTISKWTIVDNLHGIPEDCPHREKCGWLGDAHAFCEYALYNFDMANFYKKYMEDIRTQMRLVPGQNDPGELFPVPTMIAPGRRTSTIAKLDWGIATMYLPWYNYLYYGDSSIVLDYYEDMKALTRYYLSFKDENGIIGNGMGDWCPPRWDRRRNPDAMECPPVVSANAYFFDILGIMEKFAAMNQDADFRSMMQREREDLFKAFNNTYLESIPLVGHRWYGSQTATVMAIQFGLVPREHLESVLNGLAYDIVAVKGGHHSSGIHGNRYIYTVLNKHGKADLAHEILTTPGFPSQAYVMNYGFTTWPERQFFWEDMDGLTNSLNHPMHSGFAAYFYECLGGIKPSVDHPGYKEFTVNPVYQEEITWTSIQVPTPYGEAYHKWDSKDGEFVMDLHVPFNTRARLELAPGEIGSLVVNGETWDRFHEKVTGAADDQSTVLLGSGIYHLKYIKAARGKNPL